MAMDTKRYEVTPQKMSRIFCDASFNCRGSIELATCYELAEDIKEKGLDFPIHVRPYKLQPDKYDFQIISGHRRFTAYRINKETEIPCVVRYDLEDEVLAREANLRENIQRTDLTILQEAEAISFFITAGYNVSQIAKKLGKSDGWVEPRRKLMHLPDFVRRAAAEKVVNQNHINQMWAYRDNPEKLAAMIQMIKERSEKGEKAIVIREDVKITDFAKVRRPKPHEIEDFILVLAQLITNKLPDDQECFAHQVLSWAAGYASMAQAYVAMRNECARLGLPFNPPSDIKRILDSVTKA